MNWFQRFFTNPNVHAIGAGLAPGLMMAFPQYAPAIAAVGTVTGFVAAATPEHPVMVPIAAPAALAPPNSQVTLASGTSMHRDDYLALFSAVMQAVTAPKPAAPAPGEPAK